MTLRRAYPQHSAPEHGIGVLFLIAVALAFAIAFASFLPRAFALQQAASSETVAVPPEAVVSETVPVQMVPTFETLSGVLADADSAWASSQTDATGYTNQTVSLVITQQANTAQVIGVASFVAIGVGALAIAFVMRRNDARRTKVLHI